MERSDTNAPCLLFGSHTGETFKLNLVFEDKAQSMEHLGIIASFPHHSFYHGETFQPSLIFEGNDNSIMKKALLTSLNRIYY